MKQKKIINDITIIINIIIIMKQYYCYLSCKQAIFIFQKMNEKMSSLSQLNFRLNQHEITITALHFFFSIYYLHILKELHGLFYWNFNEMIVTHKLLDCNATHKLLDCDEMIVTHKLLDCNEIAITHKLLL